SSLCHSSRSPRDLHSFPTRRSSDLGDDPHRTRDPARGDPVPDRAGAAMSSSKLDLDQGLVTECRQAAGEIAAAVGEEIAGRTTRSEEHTSELQSPYDLVCRLLLEKK